MRFFSFSPHRISPFPIPHPLFPILLVLLTLSCGGDDPSFLNTPVSPSNYPKILSPFLIDDFEDGDLNGLPGGSWVLINDGGNGGTSTGDLKIVEGALRVDFKLGPGFDFPFIQLQWAVPTKHKDFRPFKRLVMKIWGSGSSINVVFDSGEGEAKGFDLFRFPISEVPQIPTLYEIDLSTLQQEGFGPVTLDLQEELSHVERLTISTSSQSPGDEGYFFLDEIRLEP